MRLRRQVLGVSSENCPTLTRYVAEVESIGYNSLWDGMARTRAVANSLQHASLRLCGETLPKEAL